jgi:NADPH:quinone reductase-like Zn-dependent oxidoreductase
MRALFQEVYGEPEAVLSVREVEQPEVPDDGVLVRVHAASIHIGDCHLIRGVPQSMRLMFGIRRPKSSIPGMDIAGTVEAVGASVSGWQVGDEVFGTCTGGFAEYAVAKPDQLARKPENLDFEQAAAVGVSAQTALQALRDQLHVQPGHKVLITGASGGVGSFAVQIAKALGAEVTAVCSTRNVDRVEALGADHVIDYTAEDFTQGPDRYDRILDNVSAHPMSQTRQVLTTDGVLLSNGGPVGGWFGGVDNVVRALLTSMVNKQQAKPFISNYRQSDGEALKALVEEGKVKPLMDQTYPLDEGPAAVAHVATGHAQGKTVITM